MTVWTTLAVLTVLAVCDEEIDKETTKEKSGCNFLNFRGGRGGSQVDQGGDGAPGGAW